MASKPRMQHYETYCRAGRLYKDRGGTLMDNEDPAMQSQAIPMYQQSLSHYLRGYTIGDRHYYPGINAASLHLLVGEPQESVDLAGEILGGLTTSSSENKEDNIWITATKAEACLLLGRFADARTYYLRILDSPTCRLHHRASMKTQVRRIFASNSVYRTGFVEHFLMPH
ncbi:MAG: hypothetical protein KDA81_10760 [Planctomycetaceae bacterium]|nr:hypothetical protein [Planctomycetaceae bacterium]